jgi:hypothetical protein
MKVLEEIKQTLANDNNAEQYIDFNKVVPQPETLNVSSPMREDDLMFYILTLAKNRAEILELPRRILSYVRHILEEHKTDKSLNELLKKYMQDYTKLILAGTADKKDDWGIVNGISLLQGHHYFMNLAFYGVATWYDWRCMMWGTKWNADCYKDGVTFENNTLSYRFDTAWGGPWQIAAAISALYEGTEVTMSTSYEDPDGEDIITYVGGRAVKAVQYPEVYTYNDKKYDSYEDAEKAAIEDGVGEDDVWEKIGSKIDSDNPKEMAAPLCGLPSLMKLVNSL